MIDEAHHLRHKVLKQQQMIMSIDKPVALWSRREKRGRVEDPGRNIRRDERLFETIHGRYPGFVPN